MTINRPGAPVDHDRRRLAPIFVSALLGAVVLTHVTQVSGRIADPDASTQSARSSQNHGRSGRLLVLTGIIAYTNPSQGFAIIGSSVQDTYLVRPGDQLPDGSSVHEIYPHHVVLEYGGKLETVVMYERGSSATAAFGQGRSSPQQMRREEPAGDALPRRVPRLTDEPSIDRSPDDETRASDTADRERRPFDNQSMDALHKQARPEGPSPSAQDPADELSDDRRERAITRRR